MRIEKRLENLLQVVGGIDCALILKCFLQFLLKVKAVTPEILNIITGILAQVDQLAVPPAIIIVVRFTEDITIVAFERLSL